MESSRGINKKLKSITWPIFVESLLFSLLGGLDTIMLGKYSDLAVASVGIANQLIWMVNLMFGIITAGTAILLAQYLGAKTDEEEIVKLCGVSIGVNLIIGIVISVVVFLISSQLFIFLKAAPELVPIGKSYMKIVGGTIFIQAILMTFTAILRSYSLTKICMSVTFIMNITNVIFNYTFIFGNFGMPELGVTGAALGTVISKIIALVILAHRVYKVILHKFNITLFKPFPKEQLINILKVGVPSAAEQISYNLSQLAITSFVNMISIESMSAKSYLTTIVSFAFIFAVSLGQGASILIGQFVGNRENDKAYNLCVYCIKASVVVSLIISLGIVLFRYGIMSMITNNKSIINIACNVLLIEILLEPGKAINIVGINSLRATGDVKFPVYIGIFSMWTFGVGIAYILGIKMGLGLIGIWLGFALDEWFRAILVLIRWKSRAWEGKSFALSALE